LYIRTSCSARRGSARTACRAAAGIARTMPSRSLAFIPGPPNDAFGAPASVISESRGGLFLPSSNGGAAGIRTRVLSGLLIVKTSQPHDQNRRAIIPSKPLILRMTGLEGSPTPAEANVGDAYDQWKVVRCTRSEDAEPLLSELATRYTACYPLLAQDPDPFLPLPLNWQAGTPLGPCPGERVPHTKSLVELTGIEPAILTFRMRTYARRRPSAQPHGSSCQASK